MTKQESEFLKLNDLWATNCEKYGPDHAWTKKNAGDVMIALLFLGSAE
jgi:hypothetical protein